MNFRINGADVPADKWYVAFTGSENHKGEHYVRTTRTFPTEDDAKKFAEERLAEGCDVSAGTLNPHFPRRTIGSSQIEGWLDTE